MRKRRIEEFDKKRIQLPKSVDQKKELIQNFEVAQKISPSSSISIQSIPSIPSSPSPSSPKNTSIESLTSKPSDYESSTCTSSNDHDDDVFSDRVRDFDETIDFDLTTTAQDLEVTKSTTDYNEFNDETIKSGLDNIIVDVAPKSKRSKFISYFVQSFLFLKIMTFESRRGFKSFRQENLVQWMIIRHLWNKCISDLVILIIYCGLGGMVFRFTEGAFENIYKCGVKRVKRDFVDQLWLSSHNMRYIFILNRNHS